MCRPDDTVWRSSDGSRSVYRRKNIEEFRGRLSVNCTLTDEELRSKIVIDVPMPVSYITKELVEQISLLEPFGKGNAKPVFAQKNLRDLKTGIYGKTQNTVKLQLMDESGTVMDGVTGARQRSLQSLQGLIELFL